MNCSKLLVNYPVLEKIGHTADQLGLEVCVVGGFVRDLFLKRPSSDIDIVCVGNGTEFAEAVAKELGDNIKVNVFKTFGTAMLRWQDYEIEFVGARKESYNRHSRNPIVTQGTLVDDQRRRDFTINTLAIRLNKPQWGELIDDLGGMADLESKIIRTPLDPEITFSDDPLRMLRAIRFATQLHFTIAPITLAAIQHHAERIKIVSQERITDELNKIILANIPSEGFELLFDTGLLKLFFPVLTNLQGKETIEGHTHKDNFYHTLQVLDNVAEVSDNLWLRWAAILHDIAKPLTKKFSPDIGFSFHGHEDLGAKMVPKIFKQLKLPFQENMTYVQKLVRLHLRPIVLAQEVVTDSAVRRLIYEAGNIIGDLMLLCRADITSNNPVRIKEYLKNFDKVEEKIQEVEEKDQIRNLQPIITGDIIMQTFQVKPSHIIGEIKAAIKEAILEGEIRNEYEEAFQYMLKLGAVHGLTPISTLKR
ncbi:MAG: tRNA nucleotidyltransferase [Candidatus Amoebophilus sp. 36-38]|nr:MAG: tRNA nucleotidyltransferase [Candidatus Amoebophilus sp. 36-38]